VLVANDVNFELVRNYFEIANYNQIKTIAIIDRDSFEISNMDGIVRLWVKVYYTKSPSIVNYHKVELNNFLFYVTCVSFLSFFLHLFFFLLN
jgi:hypothetical protein